MMSAWLGKGQDRLHPGTKVNPCRDMWAREMDGWSDVNAWWQAALDPSLRPVPGTTPDDGHAAVTKTRALGVKV